MASMICGTGAAFGRHYTTEEMKAAFRKQRQAAGDSDCDVAFADRIFDACGFDAHSVTSAPEDLFRRLGRDEYLERRRTVLLDLAAEAACQAMLMWGGERRDITHLLWGTMTGGMDSPTIDILLSEHLGLRKDVERVSVEGMGCLTGFRLVNMARQLVSADDNAKVLVVDGELRSLIGNSLPDRATRADIISACLFRDAASAAVVAQSARPGRSPCFEIVAGKSMILSETQHLASYREREDGAVCLRLDKGLPAAVGKAEPEFLAALMSHAGQGGQGRSPSMAEVDIACHTGGPRILEEVAQAAGVSEDQMQASWAIMKSRGNLSGASNLAVLDYHNRHVEGRSWVIGLAMGPGICMEGVLLRTPDSCKALQHQLQPVRELAPTLWSKSPTPEYLGKTIILAMRPWSFPIALMPYFILGCDFMVRAVEVNWTAFALTALASLACFVVCNLVNTYGDFHAGAEDHEGADDRTLVDGVLTPRTVFRMICECSLLHFVLAALAAKSPGNSGVGASLLAAQFGCLILAIGYTCPPLSLKRRGLGDLTHLLVFGAGFCMLGMLAATSTACLGGILPGLPHMLLAEGVLFANNTRDRETDARVGLWSMAQSLSPAVNLAVYAGLVGGAFVWTVLFFSPWVSALPILLCSRDAWACVQAFASREMQKLPQKSALLALQFGALLCGGMLGAGSWVIGLVIPAIVLKGLLTS